MELEKLYSSGQGGNLYLSAAPGHNSHNKGRLYVEKYAESVQYSFLDYLAGGFELNFMVAVDFTAYIDLYGLGWSRLVEKSVLIGPQDKFNELKMMTLVMALHMTKVSLDKYHIGVHRMIYYEELEIEFFYNVQSMKDTMLNTAILLKCFRNG
ncbi:hypothetical protein V8G54_005139 [Vigna mungo]|uniref:Uncharacterized protein n=1 Tax=Vigna mungo TaxID=3915 RepID=A0AAQ3PDJ2_VIGMU